MKKFYTILVCILITPLFGMWSVKQLHTCKILWASEAKELKQWDRDLVCNKCKIVKTYKEYEEAKQLEEYKLGKFIDTITYFK